MAVTPCGDTWPSSLVAINPIGVGGMRSAMSSTEASQDGLHGERTRRSCHRGQTCCSCAPPAKRDRVRIRRLCGRAVRIAALYSGISETLIDLVTSATRSGPFWNRSSGGWRVRMRSSPTVILIEMAERVWGEREKAASMLDRIPLGRLGVPADVANAVLYLASPSSAMVNGIELVVDGGFSVA